MDYEDLKIRNFVVKGADIQDNYTIVLNNCDAIKLMDEDNGDVLRQIIEKLRSERLQRELKVECTVCGKNIPAKDAIESVLINKKMRIVSEILKQRHSNVAVFCSKECCEQQNKKLNLLPKAFESSWEMLGLE